MVLNKRVGVGGQLQELRGQGIGAPCELQELGGQGVGAPSELQELGGQGVGAPYELVKIHIYTFIRYCRVAVKGEARRMDLRGTAVHSFITTSHKGQKERRSFFFVCLSNNKN